MLLRRSQALPLASCNLALNGDLRLIPVEAITLSPGQAHQRIPPVTSTTPPPPLQQHRTPTKTTKWYKGRENCSVFIYNEIALTIATTTIMEGGIRSQFSVHALHDQLFLESWLFLCHCLKQQVCLRVKYLCMR